jgi:hypothetical protein
MSRPAKPLHCGVEVLAYVFMSNHYHLLVRVPELVAREGLEREVILERIGTFYGQSTS